MGEMKAGEFTSDEGVLSHVVRIQARQDDHASDPEGFYVYQHNPDFPAAVAACVALVEEAEREAEEKRNPWAALNGYMQIRRNGGAVRKRLSRDGEWVNLAEASAESFLAVQGYRAALAAWNLPEREE